MDKQKVYDVVIIGGGLAGLAASILLARKGYDVVVIEKEKFPYHKVCGEYVSMESWAFVEGLGVPLTQMNLPLIKSLKLTAPSGACFSTKLSLGGFGISRFLLDNTLSGLAKDAGVLLLEETKAFAIEYNNNYKVQITSRVLPEQKQITAKVCCAAYGKKSNLDVKLNRQYLHEQDKRLDNYIAVKYHVLADSKEDVIELHNFYNGYCGFSKVEGDKYCLCYLTKADNLRTCNNNVEELEAKILSENPQLKKLLQNIQKQQEFPIVISQISFKPKTQVERGILMLGDTAGMITPLCGNGMSIALHTAKIASVAIMKFLNGEIIRKKMEMEYVKRWRDEFAGRLKTGRTIQKFFGSKTLSNVFVNSFRLFPMLARPVIKMTHGKPF